MFLDLATDWGPLWVFFFFLVLNPFTLVGFPGGSDGKKSPCNAGDLDSIPASGRYPGEGNGNPLQCSYLGDFMDQRNLAI